MEDHEQKNQGKQQNLEGGGHKQDGGGPYPNDLPQPKSNDHDDDRRPVNVGDKQPRIGEALQQPGEDGLVRPVDHGC